MKVRAIIEVINSRMDRAGNCYLAFIYTRTRDGKRVCAQFSGSGGMGNIDAMVFSMHGEHHDYYRTMGSEVGWNEFQRIVKDWPCPNNPLPEWVNAQLKKRKRKNEKV
jgi:hypothetical protein